MTVLPASVRVALWASAAFAGRVELASVSQHALPDLDHSSGLEDILGLWRDLGEKMVIPALPRPGVRGGLPAGGTELLGAATEAGEAIVVPGIGAAAVPSIQPFGPDGDQGWQAMWTSYDSDPVPVHTLAAVSLGEIEMLLRERMLTLTQALEGTDQPLRLDTVTTPLRRARSAVAESWGLPPGISPRALRVIELSGRLAAIADSGNTPELDSAHVSASLRREGLLLQVQGYATDALAQAATAACLELAGR